MTEKKLNELYAKIMKRVLDKEIIKTSCSTFSTEDLMEKVSVYRSDEQGQLLLAASGQTHGFINAVLKFLSGVVLFVALLVALESEPSTPLISTLIISAGIFIMSLYFQFIRVSPQDNKFTEIVLDYLKYADPSRRGGKPPSRYIADANDAEIAAAEFMRWLGFLDAYATPIGPDGGIDVTASNAVGQVKDYGKPIGSPDIQQHLGVAIGEGGKLPIFFARSGYTTNALEFANENEMPLFQFDLAGSWKPSNLHAERLWNAGADIFLENRKETTGEVSGIFSEFEEPGIQYEYDFSNESDESLEGFDDIYLEDLESDFTDPPKSLASELQELAALRDMGVLSEAEFLKAKKKLLD